MVASTIPPIRQTRLSRADFERFYEVVDGQRVENLPMGTTENQIATILSSALFGHCQPLRLGWPIVENLFILDRVRDLQRRPDVAYVSRQRWPHRRVPQTEAWDVIPDLAIEVISVSNTLKAILAKIEEYFRAGVRLVWVIYPELQQVHVYHSPTAFRILKKTDDLDGEEVVPGFRMPIANLFEELGNESDQPS